ncbi:DoxX family protein [Bradyrhizobium sp. USDA 10063]
MPNNPFTNAWQFLTANTGDYLRLGNWRYLVLALFWALLIAGIAVAFQNWREDPAQRTGRHLGIWLVRVLIGCMWFQGMLWKLPLPVSDGLQYWTEQETTHAAFEFHRTFMKDVVLPNMTIFGPIVFLAELVFAASMILGLAVRVVGVLAIAYVLQLWLGLYGNPAEWPWTYMFLALLMFLFVVESAGRSLGLDAWLRRKVPAVRDKKGFIGWFLYIAG